MKIFLWLLTKRGFAIITRAIGALLPNFDKLKKYRNVLLAPYSIYTKAVRPGNNPLFIQFAPTSICNYKCLFCEIHKDILLYPGRPENSIDLKGIQNYESFLSTVYKIVFSGGTAEPLLNRDFGTIVEYLKSRYGTKMTVNTNGSMLKAGLSDKLLKSRFDKILISYHAGSQNGYKELMTGDVGKIDANLRYIKGRKKQLGQKKPIIQFNFALQKLNADEYPHIFRKVKQLGVSSIQISKYYGGRNRLQDRKVSYDYDIDEGNRVLDEIYALALKKHIPLIPQKPSYWVQNKALWDPENFNASIKCIFPWVHLHFKPVLDDKNCHYVGVCNRIEIFKIFYDRIQFRTQKQFDLLWQHPVLQYLRETVNSEHDINPICKYCKNEDRWTLRNIDANRYAEVRDNAIKDFFSGFRERHGFTEVEGIELLSENPHSDDKFRDKLKELEN